VSDQPDLDLDPERSLYGSILFHAGRFRRLRGYRRLMAKECQAEIGSSDEEWFDRYLPGELVLGDPGARDAAIHGIQACIPHARILPSGVDRVRVLLTKSAGPRFLRARERHREEGLFVYDFEVVHADGTVCERWEGLRLKVVERIRPPSAWVAALLGPFIERRVEELVPGASVEVFVDGRPDSGRRQARSDRAIRQVLGAAAAIHRRPDGRPDPSGGRAVSVAHGSGLVLAVAGPGPIGCDMEPIKARSDSTWQDLLGPERMVLARLVAREASEDHDAASTRVWSACECLKKAGASLDAPLVFSGVHPDGWVMFTSGTLVMATCVLPVRGVDVARAAIAVLTRDTRESL
jgi:enediyne polyketide synthase